MDKFIDVQARICFAAIPLQNVVACLKSSETSTKNPQPRTHIKLLLIKLLSCIYQVHHFEKLIQEGTEVTRKLLSRWCFFFGPSHLKKYATVKLDPLFRDPVR